MSTCAALIVAAGRGTRMSGERPKQYRRLGGEPVLRRAVQVFLAHAAVGRIRVVIHPDDRPLYEQAVAGLALEAPVTGGPSRQDSVRLGLEAWDHDPPDWVLIHDAARPFVTAPVLDRVLAALRTGPAAIAAVPVVDTLKRGGGPDGSRVIATLPREGLWRAQTPQGFDFPTILAAHRRFTGAGLTDDAAVAERAGVAVTLVAGTEENVKITTEDDLRRAEQRLMAAMETCVGTGFDVHRFGPGNHVMVCGVAVPHTHGLEGHSDADVALHALTDALLGAIGEGDIGIHFPPTDARWKGVASARFLAHAARLIEDRGGKIVNVDVTVICERPRLGPYRAAIRAHLAELLALAPARVNLKATTTERLGFTGRNEGMAAQAVATVRLPIPAAAADL